MESLCVTYGKDEKMSRVGNQPVSIPSKGAVTLNGSKVTVKGPKGSLTQSFNPDMSISTAEGVVTVQRPSDERNHRALHGLTRSLISNMVIGVLEGFSKSLDLGGVGSRGQQSGKGIRLSVMLSHTVEIQPRDGIALEVEGQNLIHVRGIDKQLVGQTAAEIRKVRPPEYYKGKGIRYVGEQVRLKPGKSARAGIA